MPGKRMTYFKTCRWCGGHIDPGEKCDCRQEEKKKKDFFAKHIAADRNTGQYTFLWDGERCAGGWRGK